MVSKNMFANDVERDDIMMMEIMIITTTMRIKNNTENVRNMNAKILVSSDILAHTADSKRNIDNNK